MQIYLKTIDEITSINDILDNLYQLGSSNMYFGKSTIDTYFDKECTKIQCYSKKKRSITEILLIYETYTGIKLNIIEGFKAIIDFNTENVTKGDLFVIKYCPDVSRYVLQRHTKLPSWVNPDDRDQMIKFTLGCLFNHGFYKGCYEELGIEESTAPQIKAKLIEKINNLTI